MMACFEVLDECYRLEYGAGWDIFREIVQMTEYTFQNNNNKKETKYA